jgi:F-box interacting protein
VDLSGDVVKRIRTTTTTGGYEHRGRVLCTHFNYVIFSGDHHRVSILEPISGSIFAIPQGVGEDVARANGTCHPAWFAMGQVPSSGCYKLLRIVEDINTRDLACELFTFGDGIGQWKKVRSPRANLYPSCTNGVVVNGFTYFFYDHWEIEEPYINADNMGTCFIPSFNLETESWGKTLQGPFSLIMEDGLLSYIDPTDPLNLGEIEGCLVTIHCNDQISTINMWFLIDLENQLWSKKIVIQNEVVARDVIQGMQDLWMLEEGKMILLVRTMSRDILRIYDPTTNTARNVCRTSCLCYAGVGIYTKSLLSNC